MLLQVDGSHHRWLEERGLWRTLLLAVDDATGTAPYGLFSDQEDTEGYFRLMTGVISGPSWPEIMSRVTDVPSWSPRLGRLPATLSSNVAFRWHYTATDTSCSVTRVL